MSCPNIEAHTFLMPDYYPQFACKMGKCRHACCVGWPISISMQNYFRLLGMNCPKHLRKKLDVGMQVYDRPDPARYAYFVPDFQGDCPMRMADGRCSLHAEMGPAVLPDICRLYPRGIRAENGEYECSCANSCEAVLELLFARKEPITFVERTLTISLPPAAERTTSFETLGLTRQIRLYLISILQTRRMTLSERLGMLGKQLAKIDSLLGSKNKKALEELLREPVPCQPLPEQSCAPLPEGLHITAQMLECLNERSSSIAAYGKPAMQSYGAEADLPARYAAAKAHFEALFPHWEVFFENLLVNHMFFSQFPFQDRPVSLQEEYHAICALYAILRFLALGWMAQRTDTDDLIDAMAAAFRLIDHTNFDRYAARLPVQLGFTAENQFQALVCL